MPTVGQVVVAEYDGDYYFAQVNKKKHLQWCDQPLDLQKALQENYILGKSESKKWDVSYLTTNLPKDFKFSNNVLKFNNPEEVFSLIKAAVKAYEK